jgi:hypothetical protein
MSLAAGTLLVRTSVQVTLSTYQDGKRVTSRPYTLSVDTGEVPARITMSTQVPVKQTATAAEGPVQPHTYHPIGTTIDCRVAPLDAGRYRVTIEVDDMSVARTANETVAVAGLPSYLSYESTQAVILRDGQSVEYATATDPTNGMS